MSDKTDTPMSEGGDDKSTPEQPTPESKTPETNTSNQDNPTSTSSTNVETKTDGDDKNKPAFEEVNIMDGVKNLAQEKKDKMLASLLKEKAKKINKRKRQYGDILSESLGLSKDDDIIEKMIANDDYEDTIKSLINQRKRKKMFDEQEKKMKELEQKIAMIEQQKVKSQEEQRKKEEEQKKKQDELRKQKMKKTEKKLNKIAGLHKMNDIRKAITTHSKDVEDNFMNVDTWQLIIRSSYSINKDSGIKELDDRNLSYHKAMSRHGVKWN